MDKMTVNLNGEQKELIVREGEANQEFQYTGFHYQAHSTEAFVSLVKAKASRENAVIGYIENGMHAIVDDTVQDRRQDTISYQFLNSQRFLEWGDILSAKGITLNQKMFLNFLKRRDKDELPNLEELIFSVQNFRYVTNISGEASYEDGNNYVFGIKVKDAEGTTTLPKSIYPKIQIYKESDFVAAMEIEIEIVKPRDAGEGLGFVLSCPKFERYVEEAQAYEVEKMKKELDGYLVVAAWLFVGE